MFYIEQDNKIIFINSDKQAFEEALIFTPQYADLEIKESEVDIVEYEGTFYFVDDEEYLAKVTQKEKERIAKLSLTKREVFLGLYQAKGVTPEMIKAQITDPMALIEFEYANDYYRFNPLIDIVGASLGITPEQLDKFFETKDYTCLLPVEEENNETESNTEEPTDVSV